MALCIVMAVLASGCARLPAGSLEHTVLYLPPPPPALSGAYTPAFLLRDGNRLFNRIGSPSAVGSGEEPEIFVDPEKPAIYFETQEFTTAKNHYTNLIYRIHFPEVPLTWNSINLTAGRNPGLLFIYTLDQTDTLLLVTTVHSCGCFLAFFPTSAMPGHWRPDTWQNDSQDVYGYRLPGELPLPMEKDSNRIVFTIESDSHRISAATVRNIADPPLFPETVTMSLHPMRDLFYLPYQTGTVSFFETEGVRSGYVKNNTKILERIFMSWWALDLHVGEDKAYSSHDKSGVVFYTSLKFWARNCSDMKNFPQFLEYWGWKM